MDKFFDKLDEWFTGLNYLHMEVERNENEVTFVTMCETFESRNQYEIGVYKVFKVGNVYKLSVELEYCFYSDIKTSMLKAFQQVIKAYRNK